MLHSIRMLLQYGLTFLSISFIIYAHVLSICEVMTMTELSIILLMCFIGVAGVTLLSLLIRRLESQQDD